MLLKMEGITLNNESLVKDKQTFDFINIFFHFKYSITMFLMGFLAHVSQPDIQKKIIKKNNDWYEKAHLMRASLSRSFCFSNWI